MYGLFQKAYELARPYGRKKIAFVFFVSVVQAGAQVVSVAAVFPFLALASDPDRLQHSRVGQWLAPLIGEMSHQDLLMASGLFLIVTLFLANAASFAGEFIRARFVWGFAHWIRMRMLRRITSRSYGWFTQRNSSVLVKKATQDVNQFASGILTPIIDGSAKLLMSGFLLALVFVAEPLIALITFVVLGLVYFWIFVGLGRFRRRISDTLKYAWRGVYQQVTQLITGIKPIKVHGVTNNFLRSIEHNSERQRRMQAWMPVLANGPRYIVEPIAVAVVVGIVLYVLWQGQNMAALLPGLGLLAMAGYRLLPAIQMLYSHLSNLFANRFILEEVYEEFRKAECFDHGSPLYSADAEAASLQDVRQPERPLKFENRISLKNVSFFYPKTEIPVLRQVTLEIPKNTSIAITGATGSGKSTLIDIILGLYSPTEGKVLIDNASLDSKKGIRAWQDRIGYVSQDIFLTDDTVVRNIAFGVPDPEIDHDRVREVARMAQISNFIESSLPKTYDTIVGERGVRLSGGQRQRIALARALYPRPEVLVLDEATSALDNQTEARFMEVVYGLAENLTIIMVAHRLSTVRYCDRIVFMRKGEIQDVGTCMDLAEEMDQIRTKA